jgi:hypothetical protein
VPRAAGSSPSRSTSNESLVEPRARAAATTVVPLPPFADQQTVSVTADLPDVRHDGDVVRGNVGGGDATASSADRQRHQTIRRSEFDW